MPDLRKDFFELENVRKQNIILLRVRVAVGTLIAVKQWPYILIVLIVVAGAGYLVYSDRQRLGLGHVLGANSGAGSAGESNGGMRAALDAINPSKVTWRSVSRPAKPPILKRDRS